jgi:biotin carboxylase
LACERVLARTDGGTSPDSISLDRARALLRDHGAVMVKAVAGAGGRGLRPVTREADLAGAMRRCASEEAAAFGDGAVYVEQPWRWSARSCRSRRAR